jgi:hypothetical protein
MGVAIERVNEEVLSPAQEIEELKSYDLELKRELEEATRKWNTRWPEPEECCMILKLELERAQDELNTTYAQIEKQFADMAQSNAEQTLIEAAPCPIFQPWTGADKDKNISKKLATTVTKDLIMFDPELLKESEIKIIVTEAEEGTDEIDLLTGCQDDTSTAATFEEHATNSDILIDLYTASSAGNQGKDKVPEAARTSDDLAVLTTDFPIPCANSGLDDLRTKPKIFKDTSDVVRVLSKVYGQLINTRFESTENELKDKTAEIGRLSNELELKQPLYDIGLAIRKRKVEVGSGKPNNEKDAIIIAQGNSAAHHAQVLADATWMVAPPYDQRFKELYNEVSAEVVWKHRKSAILLDILNWKLDMNSFAPAGGVDKKTFNEHFDTVFTKIYPLFKTSDKDLELDKDIRDAMEGMKAEHGGAYERDVQAHKMNRSFRKVQQRINRQAQAQAQSN